MEPSDAGCYRAVAKNSCGEGQATINLTFEEGSKAKIPDGIPPRYVTLEIISLFGIRRFLGL